MRASKGECSYHDTLQVAGSAVPWIFTEYLFTHTALFYSDRGTDGTLQRDLGEETPRN